MVPNNVLFCPNLGQSAIWTNNLSPCLVRSSSDHKYRYHHAHHILKVQHIRKKKFKLFDYLDAKISSVRGHFSLVIGYWLTNDAGTDLDSTFSNHQGANDVIERTQGDGIIYDDWFDRRLLKPSIYWIFPRCIVMLNWFYTSLGVFDRAKLKKTPEAMIYLFAVGMDCWKWFTPERIRLTCINKVWIENLWCWLEINLAVIQHQIHDKIVTKIFIVFVIFNNVPT